MLLFADKNEGNLVRPEDINKLKVAFAGADGEHMDRVGTNFHANFITFGDGAADINKGIRANQPSGFKLFYYDAELGRWMADYGAGAVPVGGDQDAVYLLDATTQPSTLPNAVPAAGLVSGLNIWGVAEVISGVRVVLGRYRATPGDTDFNTADRVRVSAVFEIRDANTKIIRDHLDNLVFEDVIAGRHTLAQLASVGTGPRLSAPWDQAFIAEVNGGAPSSGDPWIDVLSGDVNAEWSVTPVAPAGGNPAFAYYDIRAATTGGDTGEKSVRLFTRFHLPTSFTGWNKIALDMETLGGGGATVSVFLAKEDGSAVALVSNLNLDTPGGAWATKNITFADQSWGAAGELMTLEVKLVARDFGAQATDAHVRTIHLDYDW